MASTKADADAPKVGAVKKWDGNAERDLCLAIAMGGAAEGDKLKVDWAVTHGVMTSLGYEFTKDAMSQRWSKTIQKDFLGRRNGTVTPAPITPKKTPTKRKKATEAAGEEAPTEEAPTEEAAASPPATPTATKGRKRAPAKPKAAGPAKPRGRKPKATTPVKAEAEEEAADEPAPEVKSEGTEEVDENQPSPAKKVKAESNDGDTEMAGGA